MLPKHSTIRAKDGCRRCGNKNLINVPHYHILDTGEVECLNCSGYNLTDFKRHQFLTRKHWKFGRYMRRGHKHAQHPEDLANYPDTRIIL